MSKIQKIKISNFKNIQDLEVEFKGCTAIITGGNNKGKTSFLRGLPDRIRFVRPDVIVKQGEKEGKGELTLTNGERFVWEFDATGRDKLTYITNSGRQSVTKDLGNQFFPPLFDIDKFLQSPPKSQVKQLQQIIGLDFTDIDERYQKAYDARTERNREAELYHVKLEKMIKCDRVDPVDLTELTSRKEAEKKRLNDLYLANKKSNDDLRTKFNIEKDANLKLQTQHAQCVNALDTLVRSGYSGDAIQFVANLKKAIPELVEPKYTEEMPDRQALDRIDSEIVSASETNAKAQKYKEYIEHKNATEAAKDHAFQANELVVSIENERQQMIESANMPEGISITPDGITVDGLPLDKTQISTSKLYCAALKIASINLGEVRTLYFDASFLDRKSLAEIQSWANSNDLQLLIERPDFDGGEIQYELIEEVC